MAAGTSPAIASRLGDPVLAFTAAGTGDLTVIDPSGLVQDTGVVLAAGTSPGMTAPGPFVVRS